MEVKINREIRDYSEAVYFGLNLRQFVFSILACGVAVGLYFLLKPLFGIETLSWVCIVGAAPFAALGFFKYHGMTAEKVLITYLKSEILMPKELTFISKNYYTVCFLRDMDTLNIKRTAVYCQNGEIFR